MYGIGFGTTIALILLATATSVIQAPTVEAVPPGCTEVGTATRNMMAGSKGNDKLCPLGGGDYVHARRGHDVVIAGKGNDTVIGGGGRDRLKGGDGDDRVFGIDQKSSNDVVRGGPGLDRCYVDASDTTAGCEVVVRGNTPATTAAFAEVVGGSVTIAEQLEEIVPTPPAPGPGGTPVGPSGGVPPCPPSEGRPCD